MKYILWPIVAIILGIIRLIAFTILGILFAIWHFRIPTVREVYSIDDHYLLENWNWKNYWSDVFDYDCYKELEE